MGQERRREPVADAAEATKDEEGKQNRQKNLNEDAEWSKTTENKNGELMAKEQKTEDPREYTVWVNIGLTE